MIDEELKRIWSELSTIGSQITYLVKLMEKEVKENDTNNNK